MSVQTAGMRKTVDVVRRETPKFTTSPVATYTGSTVAPILTFAREVVPL